MSKTDFCQLGSLICIANSISASDPAAGIMLLLMGIGIGVLPFFVK